MKLLKIISIILVSIICSLTVLLGTVGYFQAGNIKAFVYMMIYSQQELEAMLDHTYEDVDRYLDNNSQYTVRPAEKVEEELHRRSVIDDEEFVELLTGKIDLFSLFGAELSVDEKQNITVVETGDVITPEQALEMKENHALQESSSDEPATSLTEEDTSVPNEDHSEEISNCVAQMYVLKSTFTSELDALYNEAIGKYKALPKEQRESNKNAIIEELYPKAAELEKQCDTKVKALLVELTELLKKDGQSLELVEKIRTAYYQEKSVRKAMYMEKL